MAKIWADILVPAVIAGAVAAQTLGVDVSRASKVSMWFPEAKQDTVTRLPNGLRPVIYESIIAARDTSEVEDTLSFDMAEVEADTLPKITARDTMKVPDSLRLTDTFRYRWFVAIADSLTHRIVVDSLKADGDSVIWPRIDSLYLSDSTAAAVAKFNTWYAGLSKAERKRYDYEHYKLPVIRRRQDSTFKAQDSLKRIKDSIRQNTPRILETAFLPDSFYYKRLVAWHHNRLYNKIELFEWDTTANYHFYDYPFAKEDVGATWLGMPGSAVQQMNFFKRNKVRSPEFYAPLESWTYNADDIPMFNTKTPYTELEYYGNLFNSSDLSSDAFRVFTTQNILPELNVALEMKRYGGAGNLKNEKTDNRTYFVAGNYTGKKYLAHGGFIFNKSTRQENGGIQDNMWIRDTTVDVREIEVNIAAATNRYTKKTLFFDQSYRIPFDFIEQFRHRKDTSWVKPDTLDKNATTGFIGTSSEYSIYSKKYVDQTSATLSTFYRDVFNLNPSKSADSLETRYLDNRIFVRLQPWKEDAIVSKLEGGIGDRLQTFYLLGTQDYLKKPSNNVWNSVYAYAGAEGSLSKYFTWDATALMNFAGYEAGDFSIGANAKLNLFPFRRQPNSPLSLDAHFETSLREPTFYQQHFRTNHFIWENSFSKVSDTRISARLNIPKWKLSAEAGYALLANNVFYDSTGVAKQNGTPMSIISAALRKDFVLGPVHLENSALLQYSSDQYVVPVPLLALNLRWYAQFNIVDPKTMQLQLGVNTRYTTLWYAPSYNPVAGVFTSQKSELYGNCPVFDVFVNAQWKKCCVFIKFENAGNGWPMTKHDYFTAHHYIQTSSVLKFGISWPFYPRLGASRTMSARAGAGMGGGSGMGGLRSGLSGALGGR